MAQEQIEKELYLDFSGWVRLHPETRMQAISEDVEPFITVAAWSKLTDDEQQHYTLEDALAAIRDSEDLEYTELRIIQNDES